MSHWKIFIMNSSVGTRMTGAARLVQVRTLKRRLAYPDAYTPKVPGPAGKKDHSSYFQRAIKDWLGPKNLRGEYYRNKYYYPPQNHVPNYVVPDGNSVVGAPAVSSRRGNPGRNSALHPFPENPKCKTASMISSDLKLRIFEDVENKGLHAEEVAHKYGIKVTRVEAIIKLQAVEKQWTKDNKVNDDLKNFSQIMYNMFPLYNPPVEAENLTEIPTPEKTLHQRFLTIAESEPFGPVDAAKLFGLEPAQDTLKNLTEFNVDKDAQHAHRQNVVIGTRKDGDRTAFKFVQSKSGEVGHRYGASRRDRKKDRAIGFDLEGRMVNL